MNLHWIKGVLLQVCCMYTMHKKRLLYLSKNHLCWREYASKVILVVQSDRISLKLRRTPQKTFRFIVETFHKSKSFVKRTKKLRIAFQSLWCLFKKRCHKHGVSNWPLWSSLNCFWIPLYNFVSFYCVYIQQHLRDNLHKNQFLQLNKSTD
jgi:uncharacterized membrane protein YhdT